VLPVVALTANALAENLQACRAAGMDDVLTKPVRSDQVQALDVHGSSALIPVGTRDAGESIAHAPARWYPGGYGGATIASDEPEDPPMDMPESAFRKLVGDALRDLFEQIDDLETDDIDPRLADGVVDTRFGDDSAVVLSQQVPARELWLSANWKAWHFVFREGVWIERDTGEPMLPLLSGIFEEKLGFAVKFR